MKQVRIARRALYWVVFGAFAALCVMGAIHSGNQQLAMGNTGLPRIGSDDQGSATYPNFCALSMIRDDAQIQYTDNPGSALGSVMDENLNTSLIKSCRADQWVEIRFRGVRKWVNTIEIQYSGSDAFKFEVLDTHGQPQGIAITSSDVRDQPDSRKIKLAQFEPIPATGIRWSGTADSPTDEQVTIYEISAGLEQIDPDSPPDPDPADGKNQLLCETGDPVMGPPEITPFYNKICERADWCFDEWHYSHLLIDPSSRSRHFRCESAGGGENSHSGTSVGMDYHDMAVVAVHGAPGMMQFSPGDDVLQAPGDVAGCWGDYDCEWFCALSCSAYGGAGKAAWAKAFHGLHLQCGFSTSVPFTNGRFFGAFADYMISTGSKDPALPISISWFLANARHCRDAKNKTCAVVMVDEIYAIYDHLWGQGFVSPDPAHPGGVYWTIADPPLDSHSQQGSYPDQQTSGIAAQGSWSRPQAASDRTYRTIPAGSAQGITLKVPADICSADLIPPEYVERYQLHARVVNNSVIQTSASQLCTYDSILCNPDIGQDADGNWWAAQDEYVMCGDPTHGVIQFVNLDEYIAPKTQAPNIPDTNDALVAMQNLLGPLNLFPQAGTYDMQYSVISQEAYDLDRDAPIPDSSFNLALNVELYRKVGNYRIAGPGAAITVTWCGSDFAQLQHFTVGGWHDLYNTPGALATMEIISCDSALALLTTHGEYATIGGISPICDTLIIDDSCEVTYYETNGEYRTDILEPIRHFYCLARSAGNEDQPCDVYVPIRASLLRGAILEPSHGSHFDYGDTVTFSGLASGGESPFTYDWQSNVDGSLGTGSSIEVANLSAGSVPVQHTVTLTLADANGDTANASVSVYIKCFCGNVWGDLSNDGKINPVDVVKIVNFVYKLIDQRVLPPGWACQRGMGDVNCDGAINPVDVVLYVNCVYKAKCAPGNEWCASPCGP